MNNSRHDITLQKNTVIGRLQQVSHITPLQVKERELDVSMINAKANKETLNLNEDHKDKQASNSDSILQNKVHQQKVIDQIDLSGF